MYNLIQFIKKYHFILLFLLIEGFSVFLLASNNHYQGNKINAFSQKYIGTFHAGLSNISEFFKLKQTNKFLADENAKLHSLLKTQNSFKGDSVSFDNSLFKYQSAKVINNSVHKSNNYLTLNKGSRHGIKEKMGVITNNGVVGIIHSVSEKFSLVISVLHQKSSISVRLKDEMFLGRMIWSDFNYRETTIEDIPNHANLNVGDTIISSGNSAIFPDGVIIGEVISFQKIPGDNFYKIRIQFFEDLNRLHYVYVAESLIKQEKELLELNAKDD
ncbi:MAG: rod shape-determining protein MreC [Flavobacteriales bacterium]|nr:rod shape-determining protein MreC [Flavobacteriales bacterium]